MFSTPDVMELVPKFSDIKHNPEMEIPVLTAAILDFHTFGYISRILKIKIKLNPYLLLCHKCFVCSLSLQPKFDMSLQTDPCLKPRNYKTFSESDSNVIMSTFISQGRDKIFSCGFHHSMRLSSEKTRGSGSPLCAVEG